MYPPFSLSFDTLCHGFFLLVCWRCGGASTCISILSASGTGNDGKRWLVAAEHRLELGDIELWLCHHGWWCSWASWEWNWLWWWRQVFVWVETTDGGDVRNVRYLNHGVLLAKIVAHVLIRWKLLVVSIPCVINRVISISWRIVAVIIILILIIVPSFLKLLGHWWEGHAFWKIRQWVDESSLLTVIMVEWASFTELAVTTFLEKLAWYRFVVRVNCSQSGLAEILGEWLKYNNELENNN